MWQFAAFSFISEVFSPTSGAGFIIQSLQALLQNVLANLKVQAYLGCSTLETWALS